MSRPHERVIPEAAILGRRAEELDIGADTVMPACSRQDSHLPQEFDGSSATLSPTLRPDTPSPSASTTAEASCPITSGSSPPRTQSDPLGSSANPTRTRRPTSPSPAPRPAPGFASAHRAFSSREDHAISELSSIQPSRSWPSYGADLSMALGSWRHNMPAVAAGSRPDTGENSSSVSGIRITRSA